jgi:hypothetical protein
VDEDEVTEANPDDLDPETGHWPVPSGAELEAGLAEAAEMDAAEKAITEREYDTVPLVEALEEIDEIDERLSDPDDPTWDPASEDDAVMLDLEDAPLDDQAGVKVRDWYVYTVMNNGEARVASGPHGPNETPPIPEGFTFAPLPD